MLALRDPLPNQSDYAMTIGQAGLFVGILVAITIRIKSNAEFIESVFGSKVESKELSNFVKFLCAMLPLIIALLVQEEVLGLISTFSSLLCPYFIIIVPGLLNLKLAKELELSRFKQGVIVVFMLVVSLTLFASVVCNVYLHML